MSCPTDFTLRVSFVRSMDGFIGFESYFSFIYDTRVMMAMRVHCEHHCVSVTRVGFERVPPILETANHSAHFSICLLCKTR
jgi:hypothetical protein